MPVVTLRKIFYLLKKKKKKKPLHMQWTVKAWWQQICLGCQGLHLPYQPRLMCVFSDVWLLVSLWALERPLGHFMQVLWGCQKPFFKIGFICRHIGASTFSVWFLKGVAPKGSACSGVPSEPAAGPECTPSLPCA